MSDVDFDIICPRCRGPLGRRSDLADRCACGFEVQRLHGVPVLRDAGPAGAFDLTGQAASLVKRDSLDEARKIPFIGEALGSGKCVLQIGSGIDACASPNLIKTDAFVYSSELHFVVDAHALPFADNSFDYVYALAVFEHLHSPWLAAREIYRVLKPGGKVYVLTAFMQHLHGYPHHYFNMTVSGAARIFSRFKDVRVGPSPNSAFAELTWILHDYAAMATNLQKASGSLGGRLRAAVLKQLLLSTATRVQAASKDVMALPENLEHWKKIAPGIDIFATKPDADGPAGRSDLFKGELLRD